MSTLVDAVARGEEIIIAKGGKPAAKLVAVDPHAGLRTPGSMKGPIWIADDFDDPLAETLLDAFEAK